MSNEPKHNEPTGADIVVKTLVSAGVKIDHIAAR
jgi:hypothetical protein